MTTDKTPAKNIRDIKGEDPKEPKQAVTKVIPGNISILTVQLLDEINKNLVTIIQQNAELIKLIKEGTDG